MEAKKGFMQHCVKDATCISPRGHLGMSDYPSNQKNHYFYLCTLPDCKIKSLLNIEIPTNFKSILKRVKT